MARGYDVGRPESRVECGVRPPRCRGEEHPPTTRHPPPTPKMGLEETLALSPRRRGSTHSSRNFHALWCGIASWGLTSAATIRDQRFDIFARAASRILRSRSVRLWMPCAEILSRIGSTSLLIKSGPAVTSDEIFCPLLRNELPGARTLAGAWEPREFRNRDQRPTQRSDS